MPCAEEYAIHDFEGFERVWINEYDGIARVCEIAAFITEHGGLRALQMPLKIHTLMQDADHDQLVIALLEEDHVRAAAV